MEIIQQAYAPEYIQRMLAGSTAGEVMMVNSSGIYLLLGGEAVLLCNMSWGLIPMGISLKDFERTAEKLYIQKGQKVICTADILTFPGGNLTIIFLPYTLYSCCGTPQREYVIRAAQELAASEKKQGISMLAVPFILGGKVNGVIRRNPYCARAYLGFRELLNALCQGKKTEIKSCTDRLLGLGTGLTPSADDVILGMLFAFHKLFEECPQAVQTFRESVLEMADSHTNKISSTCLKSVIRGARFERMETVWSGLCGEVLLQTDKLLQIGNNSGAEMLLGLLLAINISGQAAVCQYK